MPRKDLDGVYSKEKVDEGEALNKETQGVFGKSPFKEREQ